VSTKAIASHPEINGSKKGQAKALFEQPKLLRIQLDIPEVGLSLLRRTRWESGDRPVAKATVREGGRVYTNVAVHLKGAVGSFRPIDDKPALTLKFDKFEPEQRFHGLNKISLNNSVQDSSFLCEKIARELFVAAGVPTPQAAHAVVELNGRYLGLYVLLEGANKRFLKQHFENASGNLYDGGFCRDITSRMSLNSGDEPNNHAGVKALRAALRQPGLEPLEEVLDMNRFLSMLALEVLLGHWDGYTLNKNNWRIFHDLQSNRMVFIPHGLDQLFGGGPEFQSQDSFIPQNVQGQVSRVVFGSTEGQRRYRERLEQIYQEVFKPDVISARVDEIVAGVAPALAEIDPQAGRAFRQRANSMKHRIVRRAARFHSQLGVPLEPIQFARNGVLPLTGWKKAPVQSGEPLFKEERDDSGKTLLGIQANGDSSGSWRTRVILPAGRYSFEGKLRLLGVTITDGDQRSGAGLRISKGVMPPKLSGTQDWQSFQHTFDIAEKAADVELVCELKATAGEAWFDADSLRLRQVR
jgi:spore coat protein CotH